MDNANLSYTITYLPCQTCHARVRCDQRGQTMPARLMRIDGVTTWIMWESKGSSLQVRHDAGTRARFIPLQSA